MSFRRVAGLGSDFSAADFGDFLVAAGAGLARVAAAGLR